jgi:hypothetical protein
VVLRDHEALVRGRAHCLGVHGERHSAPLRVLFTMSDKSKVMAAFMTAVANNTTNSGERLATDLQKKSACVWLLSGRACTRC